MTPIRPAIGRTRERAAGGPGSCTAHGAYREKLRIAKVSDLAGPGALSPLTGVRAGHKGPADDEKRNPAELAETIDAGTPSCAAHITTATAATPGGNYLF